MIRACTSPSEFAAALRRMRMITATAVAGSLSFMVRMMLQPPAMLPTRPNPVTHNRRWIGVIAIVSRQVLGAGVRRQHGPHRQAARHRRHHLSVGWSRRQWLPQVPRHLCSSLQPHAWQASSLSSAFMPGAAPLNPPLCSNTYKGGARIEPEPRLDWAANLAHQMGAWPGRLASCCLVS